MPVPGVLRFLMACCLLNLSQAPQARLTQMWVLNKTLTKFHMKGDAKKAVRRTRRCMGCVAGAG